MTENVVVDPVNPGNPQPTTEPGKSALTSPDPAPQADPAPGQKPAPAEPKSTEKPAWMAQLADDLKGDEGLTRFKTISDLGKAYKELEGKLGKSLAVPDEKSSAEDWDAYYKKMGRPDKPEDYKLEAKDLPQGFAINEKLKSEFAAKAHELGISQKTAQGFFEWYNQSIVKELQSATAAKAEAKEKANTELREDWGVKYEENLKLARKGFQVFGDLRFAKFFDDTVIEGVPLGDHPQILRMFAEIGKRVSESKLVSGNPTGQRKSDAEVIYGGTKS